MSSSGRVGALLLLLGGLVPGFLGLLGLAGVPLELPPPVGLVVEFGPLVCIGAGLIAVGLSLRGRGRPSLMIAGVLYLASVAAGIVQTATGAPFGSDPTFLVYYAAFASIPVAAALLLSDRTLRGPARWAIAIPAGCIVLMLVQSYAPVLRGVPLYLMPSFGFAIAGVLLLRQTHSQSAAARLLAVPDA